MTIKEVLEITINNLNGISVPRWLNEQIGIPIDNAVGNLKLCLEAMSKPAEEPEKEEPDGNDQAE